MAHAPHTTFEKTQNKYNRLAVSWPESGEEEAGFDGKLSHFSSSIHF